MDDRASGGDERKARGLRDLERLRALAHLFDQAFAVPGTRWRFGVDALFGLIPGLGDLAGALVGIYAMHVARRLGAPAAVQLHMLGNVALDALTGTVPVIGDLFDFAFKAQTRNLALLDAWQATPHETTRRSRRGLLLVPLLVLLVFITLTVIGVWVLFLFFQWLLGLAG